MLVYEFTSLCCLLGEWSKVYSQKIKFSKYQHYFQSWMPKFSGFMPWCIKAIERTQRKRPRTHHEQVDCRALASEGVHCQDSAFRHSQVLPLPRNLQDRMPRNRQGNISWETPSSLVNGQPHLKLKGFQEYKHSWNIKCEPSLAMSVNLHDEVYRNIITLQNPVFPYSPNDEIPTGSWYLVILCLDFL